MERKINLSGIAKSMITLSLLIAVFSCDDDGDTTARTQDNSIQSPVYSEKLIENDDFFTGSHWNDPHVLYVNGEFVMYASSDLSWDGFVKIYRLVSPDGKEWTLTNSGKPVFENSESGWDSRSIETPAVVFFNNQYHMFYTGYDVPYDFTYKGNDGVAGTIDDDLAAKHFRIGHATSTDGISWKRESTNPVVTPSDPYGEYNYDFNQSVAGEPGPVVYNDKIYLYFTAVGAAEEVGTTWQTIGLTVYDGSQWNTPRRVLTPAPELYPRSGGEGFIGYSTPNAIVKDGAVHLFYDVVLNDPWTQDKIHHAYSANGESNWIQDSKALLLREDFYWTENEIRSPAALIYNDKLYLYFAGHYYQGIEPMLCIGLNIYDQF